MRSGTEKSFVTFLARHAPAFVIGSYFLSLQFVATINLSFLILLVGLVVLLLTQPTIRWRMLVSGAALIAALLLLSTIVSACLANKGVVNPAITVSQIPGFLVFLILILFVDRKEQLGCIFWSFFIALCIVASRFFWVADHSNDVRSIVLVFLVGHPLYLAANDVLMFAVLLPAVIWFGSHLNRAAGRLFVGSYVVLLALLSILLLSRISLLIIVASCVAHFALKGRWLRFWPVLVVLGAAILLACFLDTGLAEKLQSLDLTRLRVWVVAWHMFVDAPWFGNGPGSVSVLYGQYLAQINTSMHFGHEGRNMGWAHSWFFESAAEKGVFGLVIVLLYFVYLFSALNRQLKYVPDEFIRALRLSGTMCLMAACVELSLLRIWGVYIVYLLLGLVAVFTARPKKLASDKTPIQEPS